jgi:iron complex outermembrane receptor protein
VVSLAQAQLGSMFDLERVEVLRGPQGTLYGRNATGGAVNLITARPTDELEGYARATLGGPDLNLVGEAAIGGPITEGIRGRIAVRAIDRDGYGINEVTGNDIDNAHQFSARAHLEFLPSDNMSILLTGEYHMEDDRSLAIKFREVSFPGVLDDAIPSNDGLSALGQRDGSSFASNPRNLRTNFDPINDREQWALTGIITFDANEWLTMKSLTSYRDFEAIFSTTSTCRPISAIRSRRPGRCAAAPITGNRFSSISSARNCRSMWSRTISTGFSGCSISTRRSAWKITSASTC